MLNKKWIFYDFPIRYKKEDYNEARKAVAEKMKLMPDVVSVFEAGKVAYPGISDIDFLVVFNKEANRFFVPYEPLYSDRVKYMMRHKVFLLSEEFYKNYLRLNPLLRFVYNDSNQHKIIFSKKELTFDMLDFNFEEQRILDVFFSCTDILLSRFREIKLWQENKLLVRRSLISLKGVEYMFNIIDLYGLDKNNLLKDKDDFVNRLDYLNSNWFALNKKEALEELVYLHEKGLEFDFKISFVFNNFLKNETEEVKEKSDIIKRSWSYLGLDKKYRNVYFHNFGAAYLCSDAFNTPEEAKGATFKLAGDCSLNLLYRKKELFFPMVVLPFEISVIFLELARGNGFLSKVIRRDIFTNSDRLPGLVSESVKTRIGLINKLSEVYFRKGSEKSDGKGYLHGGNNVYQYQFGKEKLRRRWATIYLRIIYWFRIIKLRKLLK